MSPRNAYEKFCPECEVEFEVLHSEARAFFPVQYCPFCRFEFEIDSDDDEQIDEDLDFESQELEFLDEVD